MLERARAERAAPRARQPPGLVAGEAERLPFGDAEFDHLSFTYLLRYVDDPAATLASSRGSSNPAARLHPRVRLPSRIWLTRGASTRGSACRCLAASLLRLVGGRPLPGASIPDFYEDVRWAPARAWGAAGIEDLQVRRMSFGGGLVIWGTVGG